MNTLDSRAWTMRSSTASMIFLLYFTACGSAPQPGATHPAPLVAATMARNTPAASCSALLVRPTPGADHPSLFPAISPADHVLGREDAAVTMMVYSDFQCGGCAELASLLKQLLHLYPDDLRIVYREFPIVSAHDKAELAARAAEAAGEQAKFWEMHDLLYEKLGDWKDLSPRNFESWVFKEAPALGLDAAKFSAAMKSDEIIARVQKAAADGQTIGLPGAPILLVNGQLQGPPINAYTLDQVIRLLRLGKRQFTACPPIVIDPLKQYIATLHTARGDIVIELFADKAPNTVNNFVFLAQQGWFDNVTFHRVISGFIAQTGDPSGTGMGNPGYFIPNEIDASLKFDRPGVVGMANTAPDTNGSQFFITLAPAPHLDGSYTIFGDVISGLDLVSRLTPRDPQPGSILPPGDLLLSVKVKER